jgi:hypothetical protein
MSAGSFWPLIFTAAACGGTGNIDGPIDYNVTGGLSGHGDGTALHIELDGTTTRPTAGGGTETAVLDALTLADLHGKIIDAQFAMLAPLYSCSCTDSYINTTSVQIDGAQHTVVADDLAPYPERLKIVIDTLKDIYQRPLGWH